jgi:hypothetical protein
MSGPVFAQTRIYQMTEIEAQLLVGAVLDAMAGITVHLEGGDRGHFLFVDCTTAVQEASVDRFISAVDPGSTLVHTTHGVAGALVA